MADPFVCVRQRAGALVKALVTDNYAYLRRYGPGAVRGRCGPALSRSSVDKLELRLALFGYDGNFFTLTFDDAHLPRTRAETERIWDAFLKRLRRWHKKPVDFYVYRIEGLHGDRRLHIHVFLRNGDFPPAVVQFLCHWYYTIFGASEKKLAGYNRCFKDTIHLFPASETRLIPDLYHIVLHLLILTNLVLCIANIIRT